MEQIFIRDREVVTMEYLLTVIANLQAQIDELKGTNQ